MRTILAIGLAVAIVFVGITAVSEQAQQVSPTVTGGTAAGDAYNLTEETFEGVGIALSPGLVLGGVAAVVLVALGVLVGAAGGGRR